MKARIIRPINHTAKINPVGKIRVGKKQTNSNGKEYPISTDYFIATGNYASLFHKAYGDKPNCIQIVFLDGAPENECYEKYEYRDDRGNLFAYGDGENFKVWHKDKYADYKNDISVIDKVPQICQSKKGWEVTLTMNFLIPTVAGIGGMWQFQTKGNASSIPNITSSYDTLFQKNGFVRGVIFDLSVKFSKSQKPGVSDRYPVVSLIPNHSEENVKLLKQSLIKLENPLKALE